MYKALQMQSDSEINDELYILGLSISGEKTDKIQRIISFHESNDADDLNVSTEFEKSDSGQTNNPGSSYASDKDKESIVEYADSTPSKVDIYNDLTNDYRFKSVFVYPISYKDMQAAPIRKEISKCRSYKVIFNKIDGVHTGYLELHYYQWLDSFICPEILSNYDSALTVHRQSIAESREMITGSMPHPPLSALQCGYDTGCVLLACGIPKCLVSPCHPSLIPAAATTASTTTPSPTPPNTMDSADLKKVLPGSLDIVVPYDDEYACKGYALVNYGTRQTAMKYMQQCDTVHLQDHNITLTIIDPLQVTSRTAIQKLSEAQINMITNKIKQLENELKMSCDSANVDECKKRIKSLKNRLISDAALKCDRDGSSSQTTSGEGRPRLTSSAASNDGDSSKSKKAFTPIDFPTPVPAKGKSKTSKTSRFARDNESDDHATTKRTKKFKTSTSKFPGRKFSTRKLDIHRSRGSFRAGFKYAHRGMTSGPRHLHAAHHHLYSDTRDPLLATPDQIDHEYRKRRRPMTSISTSPPSAADDQELHQHQGGTTDEGPPFLLDLRQSLNKRRRVVAPTTDHVNFGIAEQLHRQRDSHNNSGEEELEEEEDPCQTRLTPATAGSSRRHAHKRPHSSRYSSPQLRTHSRRSEGGGGAGDAPTKGNIIVGGYVVPRAVASNEKAMDLINTLAGELDEREESMRERNYRQLLSSVVPEDHSSVADVDLISADDRRLPRHRPRRRSPCDPQAGLTFDLRNSLDHKAMRHGTQDFVVDNTLMMRRRQHDPDDLADPRHNLRVGDLQRQLKKAGELQRYRGGDHISRHHQHYDDVESNLPTDGHEQRHPRQRTSRYSRVKHANNSYNREFEVSGERYHMNRDHDERFLREDQMSRHAREEYDDRFRESSRRNLGGRLDRDEFGERLERMDHVGRRFEMGDHAGRFARDEFRERFEREDNGARFAQEEFGSFQTRGGYHRGSRGYSSTRRHRHYNAKHR